ncbi:hypothetical protein [Microvirga brassicacearum]|uniref:DUF883 family protein n=1 Tax=Microvirga brassicacearum TaxID=2580413 RepID=A0A5N3P607_9HYPH|nr:hypothetical protein [Microvirga brassicacearum]KAB0265125.1 hypothetical protein FEZ63_19980 [Microvirga brassicacearum]
MPNPDQNTKHVDAAENSDERQEERLDHGIKESFPGSDPVSVQVSKYAPGDPRGEGETPSSSSQEPGVEGVIPGVVQQAREAAAALAEGARGAAGVLLGKSQEYAPGLESRVQRGQTAAVDAIRRHPMEVAVTAALIGSVVGVIAYELLASRQQSLRRASSQGVPRV